MIHDDCERRLRAALGEKGYEDAFRRGAGLGPDEGIDYALAREVEPAEPAEDSAAPLLTPREREVAGLIVEGMSNKAIAERLVIAQRTVEGHVEHIMSKLGFSSRAQIAAWAVRGGGRPPGHSESRYG